MTVTEPAPRSGGTTSDEPESGEGSAAETATGSESGETAAESTQDETGSAADAGGAPPCRTEQLRARFYPSKGAHVSTGPDGKTHTALRLANVGAEPCVVQGRARVVFTDGQGVELGGDTLGTPAGPGPELTLPTRGGALQDMSWDIHNGGCTDALGALIYPPGQDEPIRLPWNLGAICDDMRVEHSQLYAG
ncbi:DUF4232 domain-containing protein [Salinifilum ghardaiensis]